MDDSVSNNSGEEMVRSMLRDFGLERTMLDDPVHAETIEEVRFYLSGLLDGVLGREPRLRWQWDVEQEGVTAEEARESMLAALEKWMPYMKGPEEMERILRETDWYKKRQVKP